MFGVERWFYVPHWQRAYSRVVGGMTLDEVRRVMGRFEDLPDERVTETGELERHWTFEPDFRLTIVFDKNGRATYREMAPNYCGVTPLMGKYHEKNPEP